jgi:hypothetical protein
MGNGPFPKGIGSRIPGRRIRKAYNGNRNGADPDVNLSAGRRLPMELALTEKEILLLKEILEADLSKLLMEIANTDIRSMRKGLKEREEALRAIVGKLAVAKAA